MIGLSMHSLARGTPADPDGVLSFPECGCRQRAGGLVVVWAGDACFVARATIEKDKNDKFMLVLTPVSLRGLYLSPEKKWRSDWVVLGCRKTSLGCERFVVEGVQDEQGGISTRFSSGRGQGGGFGCLIVATTYVGVWR